MLMLICVTITDAILICHSKDSMHMHFIINYVNKITIYTFLMIKESANFKMHLQKLKTLKFTVILIDITSVFLLKYL